MDWVWTQSNHNISFVDCSGVYIVPDDEVRTRLQKQHMDETVHHVNPVVMTSACSACVMLYWLYLVVSNSLYHNAAYGMSAARQ